MNAKEIIKNFAKQKNVDPELVEDEIRRAIREGMSNKDPNVQKTWKMIAPDGKEPTVEQFLEYCVKELNKQRFS